MQPTHKYYEADAYRTEAAGRILAAEPDGNGGGKIALDGTPKEVFSQVELLHDIGLAAPETVELCWKLNQEGFDLPLDKLDPKECAQALYDMVMA